MSPSCPGLRPGAAHPHRRRLRRSGRRHARGWSLPELMLVLLVAAMLAQQAVSPFEHALHRARRACAGAAMLELALRQEQHHARRGHYAGSLVALGWPRAQGNELAWPDERRAWYRLRMQVPGAGSAPAAGYEAVAVPVGPQRGDACGSLRIDHLGHREARVPNCW